MNAFDRSKSLQELEGEDWGEPEFQSYVVTNAHRLWRVPLRDFTVEDLRIMIGQQLGLRYLIPIALENLRANPFGVVIVTTATCLLRFWKPIHAFGSNHQNCVRRQLRLLRRRFHFFRLWTKLTGRQHRTGSLLHTTFSREQSISRSTKGPDNPCAP